MNGGAPTYFESGASGAERGREIHDERAVRVLLHSDIADEFRVYAAAQRSDVLAVECNDEPHIQSAAHRTHVEPPERE